MTTRLRVKKGQGPRGRKEERLRALAESAIRARRFFWLRYLWEKSLKGSRC